ncbi:MAG TPA: hypothetical protein DCE58_06430 [Cryomorphaceae bacterium]|nr:hypothetical protein [Cryomorphaceae bacterium]
MNVAVHSVHFKASNRLLAYVQSKVETVTKVSDRVNKATVFLRLDNNHMHENKIAEVCIYLPGREVVVKKEAKTFEKSVALAMEALHRIIKRNKGKYLSFKKR